jgi:hypothetical protein
MDSAFLVGTGHKIVDLFSAEHMPPRAAIWVHNPDDDVWKLWIVPPPELTDMREFYHRAVTAISKHREVGDFDAADIRLVSGDHPIMKGLGPMYRVTGNNEIRVSSTMVNGYYLPDGIILHMTLQ